MYAVEFDAVVENGKIDIPAQYQNKFISTVKVILLKPEYINNNAGQTKPTNGFGALAHRANPALWEFEKGAFERNVVKNYDNS